MTTEGEHSIGAGGSGAAQVTDTKPVKLGVIDLGEAAQVIHLPTFASRPDHADCVIAACRAGKHVFAEKPICLNLRDGEATRRFDSHRGGAEYKTINVQYDTPYIRHLPTTLRSVETVGGSHAYRVSRPTFKEAYVFELETLHQVVVRGTRPQQLSRTCYVISNYSRRS